MNRYDDDARNRQADSRRAPLNETGSIATTVVIAIAVVAVLLGGLYIWSNRSQPEPIAETAAIVVPTPVPSETIPAPVEEAQPETAPPVANSVHKPAVPVPATVDGSDGQVKRAVADLAPGMAAWFVSEQQIRKWVLAIDVMADGDVPKQYRPLAYPLARFEPEVRGVEPNQQFLASELSYKRTGLLVNLFTAIDVHYLVQYYQEWLPLLEKAYQEQGKKDKFDQRFRVALQRVLDVKPLATTPELKKRGGVIYVYADEKLEAASDVEKMLWRMGPDNSLKIQNYLRQLQAALPRPK